jgi:phage shock protein E
MLDNQFLGEKACEMLKNNTAQLVDVRSVMEFSQGALPNAISLPLQSIMAADNLLDKDKSIILYCVTGARSNTAKNYLMQMGFKDVYDLGSYKNYCCQ